MRLASKILRIGLLSLASAVAPLAHAVPPPEVVRAQELEAALKGDQHKLRLRETSEKLIRAWELAVKRTHGADRVAAREGEARAWKLLAHWSGQSDDREKAREAERRVAAERAPAVEVASSAPAAKKPALAAKREPERLPKPAIEVEGDRFAAVLAIKHEIHVRRELIPASGGRGARVFFDVSPLVASPEALKPTPIEHGVVERLRIGQLDRTTVRFVLDMQAGKRVPERVELVPGTPARIEVEPAEAHAEAEVEAEPGEPKPVAEVAAEARAEPVAEPPAADAQRADADPLADLLELRLAAAKTAAPPTSPAPEPAKLEPAKLEPAKVEPAKAEPAKVEPAKPEPANAGTTAAELEAALDAVGGETDTIVKASLPPAKRDWLVKIRRVVVDAGHGGKDTGAIGKRGTREKDVNLAIALRLGKALERLGVEVVYTRHKDVFVTLGRRAEIANHSGADLFVSVHANAHRNAKIEGIETYYLNTTSNRYAERIARRENSERSEALEADAPEPEVGQSDDDEGRLPPGSLGRDLRLLLADLAMRSATEESRRLAGYVQASAVGKARHGQSVRDLGVKHALFFVLVGARMPSVLIESGFLTHPEEEARLAGAAYQTRLAAGIAQGVQRFIQERNSIAAR